MSKIYQAAEEILLVLTPLAPQLKPELEALLDRVAANEDVELAILNLLNTNENTREWLQDKLSDEDSSHNERGYSSLPGDSTTSIQGIKLYRCPVDGCTEKWFMCRAGQKVPQCPKHPESTFVEATTA